MERKNICKACNNIIHGVKTRVAVPHTCSHIHYSPLPLHYEFNEILGCKRQWHDCVNLYGEENIQLVISTNFYTSGYWIEKREGKSLKSINGDYIYTGQEVLDLFDRVTKEIALSVQENRLPRLTL